MKRCIYLLLVTGIHCYEYWRTAPADSNADDRIPKFYRAGEFLNWLKYQSENPSKLSQMASGFNGDPIKDTRQSDLDPDDVTEVPLEPVSPVANLTSNSSQVWVSRPAVSYVGPAGVLSLGQLKDTVGNKSNVSYAIPLNVTEGSSGILNSVQSVLNSLGVNVTRFNLTTVGETYQPNKGSTTLYNTPFLVSTDVVASNSASDTKPNITAPGIITSSGVVVPSTGFSYNSSIYDKIGLYNSMGEPIFINGELNLKEDRGIFDAEGVLVTVMEGDSVPYVNEAGDVYGTDGMLIYSSSEKQEAAGSASTRYDRYFTSYGTLEQFLKTELRLVSVPLELEQTLSTAFKYHYTDAGGSPLLTVYYKTRRDDDLLKVVTYKLIGPKDSDGTWRPTFTVFTPSGPAFDSLQTSNPGLLDRPQAQIIVLPASSSSQSSSGNLILNQIVSGVGPEPGLSPEAALEILNDMESLSEEGVSDNTIVLNTPLSSSPSTTSRPTLGSVVPSSVQSIPNFVITSQGNTIVKSPTSLPPSKSGGAQQFEGGSQSLTHFESHPISATMSHMSNGFDLSSSEVIKLPPTVDTGIDFSHSSESSHEIPNNVVVSTPNLSLHTLGSGSTKPSPTTENSSPDVKDLVQLFSNAQNLLIYLKYNENIQSLPEEIMGVNKSDKVTYKLLYKDGLPIIVTGKIDGQEEVYVYNNNTKAFERDNELMPFEKPIPSYNQMTKEFYDNSELKTYIQMKTGINELPQELNTMMSSEKFGYRVVMVNSRLVLTVVMNNVSLSSFILSKAGSLVPYNLKYDNKGNLVFSQQDLESLKSSDGSNSFESQKHSPTIENPILFDDRNNLVEYLSENEDLFMVNPEVLKKLLKKEDAKYKLQLIDGEPFLTVAMGLKDGIAVNTFSLLTGREAGDDLIQKINANIDNVSEPIKNNLSLTFVSHDGEGLSPEAYLEALKVLRGDSKYPGILVNSNYSLGSTKLYYYVLNKRKNPLAVDEGRINPNPKELVAHKLGEDGMMFPIYVTTSGVNYGFDAEGKLVDVKKFLSQNNGGVHSDVHGSIYFRDRNNMLADKGAVPFWFVRLDSETGKKENVFITLPTHEDQDVNSFESFSPEGRYTIETANGEEFDPKLSQKLINTISKMSVTPANLTNDLRIMMTKKIFYYVLNTEDDVSKLPAVGDDGSSILSYHIGPVLLLPIYRINGTKYLLNSEGKISSLRELFTNRGLPIPLEKGLITFQPQEDKQADFYLPLWYKKNLPFQSGLQETIIISLPDQGNIDDRQGYFEVVTKNGEPIKGTLYTKLVHFIRHILVNPGSLLMGEQALLGKSTFLYVLNGKSSQITVPDLANVDTKAVGFQIGKKRILLPVYQLENNRLLGISPDGKYASLDHILSSTAAKRSVKGSIYFVSYSSSPSTESQVIPISYVKDTNQSSSGGNLFYLGLPVIPEEKQNGFYEIQYYGNTSLESDMMTSLLKFLKYVDKAPAQLIDDQSSLQGKRLYTFIINSQNLSQSVNFPQKLPQHTIPIQGLLVFNVTQDLLVLPVYKSPSNDLYGLNSLGKLYRLPSDLSGLAEGSILFNPKVADKTESDSGTPDEQQPESGVETLTLNDDTEESDDMSFFPVWYRKSISLPEAADVDNIVAFNLPSDMLSASNSISYPVLEIITSDGKDIDPAVYLKLLSMVTKLSSQAAHVVKDKSYLSSRGLFYYVINQDSPISTFQEFLSLAQQNSGGNNVMSEFPSSGIIVFDVNENDTLIPISVNPTNGTAYGFTADGMMVDIYPNLSEVKPKGIVSLGNKEDSATEDIYDKEANLHYFPMWYRLQEEEESSVMKRSSDFVFLMPSYRSNEAPVLPSNEGYLKMSLREKKSPNSKLYSKIFRFVRKLPQTAGYLIQKPEDLKNQEMFYYIVNGNNNQLNNKLPLADPDTGVVGYNMSKKVKVLPVYMTSEGKKYLFNMHGLLVDPDSFYPSESSPRVLGSFSFVTGRQNEITDTPTWTTGGVTPEGITVYLSPETSSDENEAVVIHQDDPHSPTVISTTTTTTTSQPPTQPQATFFQANVPSETQPVVSGVPIPSFTGVSSSSGQVSTPTSESAQVTPSPLGSYIRETFLSVVGLLTIVAAVAAPLYLGSYLAGRRKRSLREDRDELKDLSYQILSLVSDFERTIESW